MPKKYIIPKAPYDFSLCAAIFTSGEPEIRTFRKGTFAQVLRNHALPVLAEVRSIGTTEAPKLSLVIRSNHSVDRKEEREVMTQVASMFSTADDLAPFYREVNGDPIMADLTRRLRGLKSPETPTVFEALTDSIIEQQISLKVAHTIENRLIRMVGRQAGDRWNYLLCVP